MIHIEQDNLPLDSAYPFQIRELTLFASDNCKNPFHWHTYFEITYIKSGRGRYYTNGQIYEVEAGDTVIFNNAESHGWQVLDQEMNVIVIIFESDFLASFTVQDQLDYLKPLIEHGSNFQNKVDHTGIISEQIPVIMKSVLKEWARKKLGYRMMIQADMIRLLTLLTRHYQGKPISDELLSEKQKALERLGSAFLYINENCCRKITLKETADTVFMSPNYFSHFFHKATETSFCDYVTVQRIIRANEMMDNTNKSIQNIAVECGFHNVSNFYRLYKKHTGISPGKRTSR